MKSKVTAIILIISMNLSSCNLILNQENSSKGLAKEFYGPFADLSKYLSRLFSDKEFAEFFGKMMVVGAATVPPCVFAT